MTANIVSIVALVLAVALVFIGVKLIRGSWQIPAERKSKYAISAIGAALILGLTNVWLALKPTWPKRLLAKLAK